MKMVSSRTCHASLALTTDGLFQPGHSGRPSPEPGSPSLSRFLCLLTRLIKDLPLGTNGEQGRGSKRLNKCSTLQRHPFCVPRADCLDMTAFFWQNSKRVPQATIAGRATRRPSGEHSANQCAGICVSLSGHKMKPRKDPDHWPLSNTKCVRRNGQAPCAHLHIRETGWRLQLIRLCSSPPSLVYKSQALTPNRRQSVMSEHTTSQPLPRKPSKQPGQ